MMRRSWNGTDPYRRSSSIFFITTMTKMSDSITTRTKMSEVERNKAAVHRRIHQTTRTKTTAKMKWISDDDSEDSEVERARQRVYDTMSPISFNPEPSVNSPPRFRVEVEGSPIHAPAVRGGASQRGRGRGRGRTPRSAWTRGQPYVEMLISDDELPESVQADIRHLIASRRHRAVPRRDVEEGDDDEVGIDEFFDAQEFQWAPMHSWVGQKEEFQVENPGPTQHFEDAYESFRAIWDDDILSHIVAATNRYALTIESPSFRQRWVPTNVDEILKLLAFWMMLGIIKMPSIKSCFSRIPLMQTEVFRYLFAEQRYWDLNRAFHLANDSSAPASVLDPMGYILDQLNNKFKSLYTLGQDVCIDESLTLWKGPLSFKLYIRSKTARFGIKTYQLTM